MEALQCLRIQPQRLIKGSLLKLLEDIEVAEKKAEEEHFFEVGQREDVPAFQFDIGAYCAKWRQDNSDLVQEETTSPEELAQCIFCGQS